MRKLTSVVEVLSKIGKKNLAKRLVDLFCKNMSYLNDFEEVGFSYSFLGYFEKAISIFEKALVLSPNIETSFYYRNVLSQLYVQTNKPQKALIYININEKIQPLKELAYLRLQAEQQIEILKGIKTTGYWDRNLAKKHHIHSSSLGLWISKFLNKDVPTYDFGCGLGNYLKDLENEGFTDLTGFEGEIPDNVVFSNIKQQDLTQKFEMSKKGNVIFLEVGEHIPEKYQSVVLDNVCNACQDKLVLSWAVRGQGGTGHVNELDNDEVIPEVEKRGFKFISDKTQEVRSIFSNDPCPWFIGSIMIFERKK